MRFRPLLAMLCALVLVTPDDISAVDDAWILTRLATQRRLHRDPVWLRLLYYEADGSRSASV